MEISLKKAIIKRKIHLPLMLIVLLLYGLNKLVLSPQLAGSIGEFFRFYFNDLICPLFYLSCVQILLIWAGYEMSTYKVVLFWGLLGGVIWEFLIPLLKPTSVCDYKDLLCYFLGSTLYYVIYKRSL